MSSNRQINTVYTNREAHSSDEIMDAIQCGLLDKLILLVDEKNYSLNVKDQEGFSPVCLAAKYGHLHILEWLIKDKKISINKIVEWNKNQKSKFVFKTPLQLAAIFDHVEIVKWIINETNCEFDNEAKSHVLNFAITKGDIPFIEWLIAEKNCVLNRREIIGHNINRDKKERENNSLYIALKAGQLSVVKWLIEKNEFSLNIVNRGFKNLLHVSLYLGQLEITKWLVEEKKCSLEEINQDESIILLVIKEGHANLLEWLVDEKKFPLDVMNGPHNSLIYALHFSQVIIAKWLVEKKQFSLNVKDNENLNPLLLACAYGPLEAVKWLVEKKGMTLNVDDGFNRGPIIQAISYGQFDILKYLVEEKCCSLEVKSSTNGTHPIHYAALGGYVEILKWLSNERNCKLEVTNNANQNLLQLACEDGYQNEKVIQWLINEKNVFADRNFRNAMKDYYLKNLREIDIQALYHLVINSADAAELDSWLQIVDMNLRDSACERWAQYILKKIYEPAVQNFKTKDNHLYAALLEHYCQINQYSVGHIRFLLQDNLVEKAIDSIYSLIHDKAISLKVKNQAKLMLAEIFLQGLLDIDEEHSPLLFADPFLSDNDCIIKRAIQAYYLLHDIDNQFSQRIKLRLHNILSGNMKITQLAHSQTDWLPKAKHYYAKYVCYKEMPNRISSSGETNLNNNSNPNPDPTSSANSNSHLNSNSNLSPNPNSSPNFNQNLSLYSGSDCIASAHRKEEPPTYGYMQFFASSKTFGDEKESAKAVNTDLSANQFVTRNGNANK